MNFKIGSKNTLSLMSCRTRHTTTQFHDSEIYAVHDIFVLHMLDINNAVWYVPEITLSVISVGMDGNATHK